MDRNDLLFDILLIILDITSPYSSFHGLWIELQLGFFTGSQEQLCAHASCSNCARRRNNELRLVSDHEAGNQPSLLTFRHEQPYLIISRETGHGGCVKRIRVSMIVTRWWSYVWSGWSARGPVVGGRKLG